MQQFSPIKTWWSHGRRIGVSRLRLARQIMGWLLLVWFAITTCGLLLAAWEGVRLRALLAESPGTAQSYEQALGRVNRLGFGVRIGLWNPVVLVAGFVPSVKPYVSLARSGSEFMTIVRRSLAGNEQLLVEALASLDQGTSNSNETPNLLSAARLSAAVSPRFLQEYDAVAGLLRTTLTELESVDRLPDVAETLRLLLEEESTVRDLLLIAGDAPRLLGEEKPIRYFVALTTTSELRGLQGLIGQFAVFSADRGVLRLEKIGLNSELKTPRELPSMLRETYGVVYGTNNPEWLNMTMSPFVSDLGLQVASASLDSGLQVPQVVVAMDIKLLSRMVELLGESVTTKDGSQLTSTESIAAYLTNGIYFDFPVDQSARKEFQRQISSRLMPVILSDPRAMASRSAELLPLLSRGHFAIWVDPTAIDSVINRTSLGRVYDPTGRDVWLAFNNLTANKLDFYLQPRVSLTEVCTSGNLWSRWNIDLINEAIPGYPYPEYLALRADLRDEIAVDADRTRSLGSHLDASVFLPASFRVVGLRDSSGAEVGKFESDAYGGRVIRFHFQIPAGATASFELTTIRDSCDQYVLRLPILQSDWVRRLPTSAFGEVR